MAHIRNNLAECALALQFLSRLPAGHAETYSADRWARIPRWFGIVGLVLGVLAAAILWLAAQVLPQGIAVLLTLGAMLLLTGALHEDGLADAADGMGGGRTAERALDIMRDSRIGSYGVLALIMALALQAACLALMPLDRAMGALVLAHVFSRSVMALALGQGRYLRVSGAGTGLDRPLGVFGLVLTLGAVLCALGLGLVLRVPAPALLVAVFISGGVSAFWLRVARRKLGGDTGDTLGAAQVIAATTCLVGVAAWL
ncbi:adenosylcobinamide-GDP ribazoletransferase [Roseinatronobacter alkalisoli]|uniref:Adenosylcobinamide-GDP ribazoletransferase n=1 Tax=Roseinatronobacter alkalisoli TaxID=3028235 RepID=A0ABT5T9J1_9RHOB|nr:adenosylcobinamide-GDP ribazoletransferase [Roseinatronobacter sp. HJB301]MDD7971790.1 adenosylcobinamide-GDP ribazoletransferase [Roseinatronobacter sp. HJB301]